MADRTMEIQVQVQDGALTVRDGKGAEVPVGMEWVKAKAETASSDEKAAALVRDEGSAALRQQGPEGVQGGGPPSPHELALD
jgi:hypothetical protein